MVHPVWLGRADTTFGALTPNSPVLATCVYTAPSTHSRQKVSLCSQGQRAERVAVETHAGRADVLPKVASGRGTWDERNVWCGVQCPGERQLGRGASEPSRQML